MSDQSLKASYQRWLWSFAIADLFVVTVIILGNPMAFRWEEAVGFQVVPAIILPVAVVLMVNLLPHRLKCMAVYWRPYGWLPGSEAFTRYAPADARINMSTLARHIGTYPTDHTQNARWYQLYKCVENEPEVREVHRQFLMYRDIASLSIPMIFAGPLMVYFSGGSALAQWLTSGLFFLQYILSALSARTSGIRFVTNVVALHSSRRIKAR